MDPEKSLSHCVLVVDDVPDTLNVLTNWLVLQGYDTLTASDGQEAIEVAARMLPDLILLDVMMPKMDGIETCRQLKTRTQTASIPVILVTAKDPSDARSEGMMAGAIDYITKPVNFDDLKSRVEAVFSENSERVDVQRLLDEVAHTTMAILDSSLVWLLSFDSESNKMVSEMLATSTGSREEAEFLLNAASQTGEAPEFSLDDRNNPLVEALVNRQASINVPNQRLQDSPSTIELQQAADKLKINYLTIVPLIAAGKSVGLMVLGFYQPHDMESPRAHHILSAFGSQAATALDYARLLGDLRPRENEAMRERAFRQMILDTMSDALVVIDSSGSITFTNRRLLRMTGYPSGYLEGRHVGELFHPEDRDEVVRGLLSEHATTMRFDQRLITRSESVIPDHDLAFANAYQPAE